MLQYQIATEPEKVKSFIDNNNTEESIQANIKELLPFSFKEGKQYSDLPLERLKQVFEQFNKAYEDDFDHQQKQWKRLSIELDAVENLKRGVVANLIGVICFVLKQDKYKDKTIISLEDLTRSFGWQKDRLDGKGLSNKENFKEQENLALAGLGTYHFFEIQFLKKLSHWQINGEIKTLVPLFRSNENYEKIVRRDKTIGDTYVNYPYGIVQFVDPSNTSKRCPNCSNTTTKGREKKKFYRNKDNSIKCQKCGLNIDFNNPEKVISNLGSNNDSSLNLKYILNGDDNGAYNIARKMLVNLDNRNNKRREV